MVRYSNLVLPKELSFLMVVYLEKRKGHDLVENFLMAHCSVD